VKFRDASLQEHDLGSKGIELNWQLQNNARKKLGYQKKTSYVL
jgi:hypothetical protein